MDSREWWEIEWNQLKQAFQYTTKEENVFKYKRCDENVIIQLQTTDPECTYTAETNEARTGVKNRYFAKFRAEQLYVNKIYDIKSKSWLSSYHHKSSYAEITYIVGEWVVPDKFDSDDLDNICSNGIHYFNSLEAAFCYVNLLFGFGENGQLPQKSPCICDGCERDWNKQCDFFLPMCR